MSSQRSPETEIRHLRALLRNARAGFRMVPQPPPTYPPSERDGVAGYARDMIRLINDALAPKRRRRHAP